MAWTDNTWHFRLATILISQMQVGKNVQEDNVISTCYVWLRHKLLKITVWLTNWVTVKQQLLIPSPRFIIHLLGVAYTVQGPTKVCNTKIYCRFAVIPVADDFCLPL